MVQIGYIGFEEVLNTALTKVGNCLQFSSSWPCGQTLKDWVKDMCGNKCRRGINNEASPLGGTTMSACSYCKGKDPWVSLPKPHLFVVRRPFKSYGGKWLQKNRSLGIRYSCKHNVWYTSTSTHTCPQDVMFFGKHWDVPLLGVRLS
ncbi:uncharacterized protein [Elaeis guineensis]